MGQSQIREASAIVVLTGDRLVATKHFETVLELERAVGTLSPEYEAALRKFVPLAFSHGPLGLGWLWKALLAPLARVVVPVPSIPAVQKRFWLAKQVMLCAMNLMLAAEAPDFRVCRWKGLTKTG